MIIYKVTNTINGKVYIGQTINSLSRRWNGHCGSRSKSAISLAIKKYGKENFIIKEIDGANSLTELNYLEEHYIYINNCIAPNGYNLTNGGLNHIRSEETRKKLSIAHTGRPSPRKGILMSDEQKSKLKGRVFTKEHRDNIGKTSKGRYPSEESRRKMSKSRMGNKYSVGRKLSQETIDKMNIGRAKTRELKDKK